MANVQEIDFGSESEGEDFNPAPAVDSDDEAGSDHAPSTSKKNGSSSARRAVQADADDNIDSGPRLEEGTEDVGSSDQDEDDSDAVTVGCKRRCDFSC